MSDPIALDFPAAQRRRVRDGLAAMRGQFAPAQDDVRVLTAMAVRQDAATRNTPDLLNRTMDRIARLEDEARAT
jgi:hypothetical protein